MAAREGREESAPRAPTLAPEVRSYYERAPEETRLQEGVFKLEAARTRALLERVLPDPPAGVVDVGGAAGAYSFWLADRGYEVHLVEPVERLVDAARRRNEERSGQAGARRLTSLRVGDARALPLSDGSVDAALLLGPLYHLPDREDRLRALGEAFRVLAPGGVVAAAGISRFASALDGLRRGWLDDPEFAGMVREDLETGVHRNPTGRLELFTTAYMHRPDELGEEVEEAGFSCEGVRAVEGPAWLVEAFAGGAEPDDRRGLMGVLERLESEPGLLGVSAHLLAVGRKPA